jgi:hypothetical protein
MNRAAEISRALDVVYQTTIGEDLRKPRPFDVPEEAPTWYLNALH